MYIIDELKLNYKFNEKIRKIHKKQNENIEKRNLYYSYQF